MNAFLEQVMDEGMRRVRAEGAELRAGGLMEADGKLLVTELPPNINGSAELDSCQYSADRPLR